MDNPFTREKTESREVGRTQETLLTPNAQEQTESEQTIERPQESPEQTVAGKVQALGKLGKAAQTPTAITAVQPKTPVRQAIESVLSEHINTMLANMTPEQKQAFKVQANETASEIERLVDSAKATAKKLLHLIRKWLKMIPGVNEFFVEQEAKIKADRILELQDNHPADNSIIQQERK